MDEQEWSEIYKEESSARYSDYLFSLHTAPMNFNKDLGYPYGAFDPRCTMDLYEDIKSGGVDLTVQAKETELREAIVSTLEHINPCILETIDDDSSLADLCRETASVMFMDDDGMHDYEYETSDGILLEVRELGGAPLAHVKSSKWITWCKRCSPCVPGAGNLEEPANPPQRPGIAALCLDPENMQVLANKVGRTYMIQQIHTTEITVIAPEKEAADELLQ